MRPTLRRDSDLAIAVLVLSLSFASSFAFSFEPPAENNSGDGTESKIDFNECFRIDSIVERLACYSPRVRQAEENLTWARHLWLESLQPEVREKAITDTRARSALLQEACGRISLTAPPDSALLECAIGDAKRHINFYLVDALERATPSRPIRALVAADTVVQNACRKGMTVKWGVTRESSDHEPVYGFIAHDTQDVAKPYWVNHQSGESGTIEFSETKARVCAGLEPVPIWRVNVTKSRFNYTWYVFPPGDEGLDLWRKRVLAVLNDSEALEALSAVMRHPSAEGQPHRFVSPARYTRGTSDPTAPSLYDPSNTDVFDGTYTRSEIILIDGIAYLRATSITGFHHIADVAMFRFGDFGELETLCWEEFGR